MYVYTCTPAKYVCVGVCVCVCGCEIHNFMVWVVLFLQLRCYHMLHLFWTWSQQHIGYVVRRNCTVLNTNRIAGKFGNLVNQGEGPQTSLILSQSQYITRDQHMPCSSYDRPILKIARNGLISSFAKCTCYHTISPFNWCQEYSYLLLRLAGVSCFVAGRCVLLIHWIFASFSIILANSYYTGVLCYDFICCLLS